MKKVLKIIGIMVLTVIVGLSLLFIASRKSAPPQIVANFTELNKIEKISKFRSCAGHTTVPQDKREMKRSMKHYFAVKPEYLGGDTVEIYSPYDGIITAIREDRADGLEGEIWIAPKNIFAILPPIGQWNFSVQHINVLQGLKRGSTVKAGELIGHAAVATANRNTFDVVYAKGGVTPKRIDNWVGPFVDLDSIFNHMSENILAEYLTKGVSSKDDFIISKETRDENPCIYKDDGPYFLNQDDPKNWVVLLKTDLIRVDYPRPNQSVKSPLVITGEARGSWFFEASFPVVLTNWDGLIIAQGIATAKGEWMTNDFVPFEAALTFAVDKNTYSRRGTLVLRKDNPSGLPEHDDALEIPVMFE